ILEVVEGGGRPPLPVAGVSIELRELITSCWAHNPSLRPSFEEILGALETCAVPESWRGMLQKANIAPSLLSDVTAARTILGVVEKSAEIIRRKQENSDSNGRKNKDKQSHLQKDDKDIENDLSYHKPSKRTTPSRSSPTRPLPTKSPRESSPGKSSHTREAVSYDVNPRSPNRRGKDQDKDRSQKAAHDKLLRSSRDRSENRRERIKERDKKESGKRWSNESDDKRGEVRDKKSNIKVDRGYERRSRNKDLNEKEYKGRKRDNSQNNDRNIRRSNEETQKYEKYKNRKIRDSSRGNYTEKENSNREREKSINDDKKYQN
ncbi:unnamed protein product, partial [Meganyctiphanes norvegica]